MIIHNSPEMTSGIEASDADLAETFGPRWAAVVEIVDTAATATAAQRRALRADYARAASAAYADYAAASAAAYTAAYDASAASAAAYSAAYTAAYDAYDAYADYAAYAAYADYAAAYSAASAAVAAATWDLATSDGPYTITQRNLLIAPWAAVFGLPASLADDSTVPVPPPADPIPAPRVVTVKIEEHSAAPVELVDEAGIDHADSLMDALGTAWGIIANASNAPREAMRWEEEAARYDGQAQSGPEAWCDAAIRFRETYHEILARHLSSRPEYLSARSETADILGDPDGTIEVMTEEAP